MSCDHVIDISDGPCGCDEMTPHPKESRQNGEREAWAEEAAEDAVNQAYRCAPDNREYYNKWIKAKGERK